MKKYYYKLTLSTEFMDMSNIYYIKSPYKFEYGVIPNELLNEFKDVETELVQAIELENEGKEECDKYDDYVDWDLRELTKEEFDEEVPLYEIYIMKERWKQHG